MPKPKVGDPIIFRAQPDGPERMVRPCSGKHREYWLAGYIVASCRKCTDSLRMLLPDSATFTPTPEGTKGAENEHR